MNTFMQQIEEIMEITSGSVSPSDPFKEHENWDSLTFLILLNQLNDTYGVSISNAELMKVETLQELWDLIQEKK